jgi:hypothetical protein
MPVPDDYGTTTYVPQARGYALLLTELIMISVTLLIVGLRLYTRVRILGAMHSDDWWIMLATSVLVGLTVIHGVGKLYQPAILNPISHANQVSNTVLENTSMISQPKTAT